MIFSTTNLERMRIAANGNVGIGTSTPYQKLEVNGNILMSFPNTWIGAYPNQVFF